MHLGLRVCERLYVRACVCARVDASVLVVRICEDVWGFFFDRKIMSLVRRIQSLNFRNSRRYFIRDSVTHGDAIKK